MAEETASPMDPDVPESDAGQLTPTVRSNKSTGVRLVSNSAVLESTRNTAVVNKPVEAVLMRPKKGKISLQAKRFFNVLLKHAQSSGVPSPGQYYRIPLPRFLSDSAFESRNISYVVDVLNNMMATVVNWGDTPDKFKNKKANWKGAPLLAFAELDKSPSGTTLVFDLHPEIRHCFANPNDYAYAKVSLAVNGSASTHAALVLYEVGMRYLTSPGRVSKREPWRKWVGPITGNPDLEDTVEYKYFARDILKPAIAEVNSIQSDFVLTMNVELVHRKVDTLQFEVQRRTPAPRIEEKGGPLTGLEVWHLPLVGQMLQWGLKQQNAEELLKQHGPRRVQAAIEYTNARLATIKAPGGYLKTLLKDADASFGLDAGAPLTATTTYPPKLVEGQTQNVHKLYREAMKKEAKSVFESAGVADKLRLFTEFEATGLQKCGELLKERWGSFRQMGADAKLSGFLEHPFIEWLARDRLQASAEEVFSWGLTSGVLQYRPPEQ